MFPNYHSFCSVLHYRMQQAGLRGDFARHDAVFMEKSPQTFLAEMDILYLHK
jgi:hypothetical protein